MRTNSPRGGTNKAVTLTTIAQQAGVSVGAVSVALNGSNSNVGVSATTRERIHKIAAELGYRPNAIAQSLRNRRTDVIGFYNAQEGAFDPRFPFYAAVLSGIQAGCAEQRKHLLIHGNFEDKSDDDVFLMLNNGQIDGLVMSVRTVKPLVERLIASHLPVVTVAEAVPGLPCVGVDEAQGARLLAEHIAAQGHKNLLYRIVREEGVPQFQQLRMGMFVRAARALGLKVRETRHEPDSPRVTPAEAEILLSTSSHRPTAVVCWSDHSADCVAQFCRQNGLRIPDDIALTGFDDFPALERPALRLTTIHAPWDEVARVAVGVLTAQCQGHEVPAITRLPVALVKGDTT